MRPEQQRKLAQILALVFVIGISITLLAFRNQIKHLGIYGYPGVFVFSVLGSATIIIPMPTLLVTTTMGAVLDPFWVGIAAGVGSAVGEMTGYLAGFSGQTVVEKSKWYLRLEGWMGKYGSVTVLFLSFIPASLIDIAGMIAGASKMPWYKFLFWCMVGKILKMWLFAYGGAGLLSWLPFGPK